MTDLTTRPVPERQDPDHSGATERREHPLADPAPLVPGGVELGRFLALARLTSAQALEIGAGVLAAVERDAAPDDGGPGSDPVAVAPCVAADGRVVLGAAGNGGRVRRTSAAGTSGHAADAVLAVLADVAAAAGLPGSAADPTADQRLVELHRAVRDLPDVGVPVVARRLQEAAAAIDHTAVRAELAALVRAVGGVRASVSGAAGTGEPPVASHERPVERSPRRSRSAGRRVGAWLLSILVLAAVVAAEVVLLRDDIAVDIEMLLDAGRGADQPSAAPTPDGPQLTAPAPAAAGNVVAVDLRLLGRCPPGAPCSVRLLVRLVPAAEAQTVTWRYQVVDLCTGTSSIAPGGTVTLPPQADRVEAVGIVPLPPADGVAVVAVTDAPAAAAAAPVVVGSCRPGPDV